MKPLRIMYVSQYYPPEIGAAPTRASHFVRCLVDAGHKVKVLTGLPNHPAGILDERYAGGRLRAETLSGVEITRKWLYTSASRSFLSRLLNQISFAVGVWFATRRIPEIDLIIASVPPTFLGLSAVSNARRQGIPIIVDVRDDWPRAAIAVGYMSEGMATSVLAAISDRIYRRADALALVTPGMLREFTHRGLDSERLNLIMNGADTRVFTPSAKRDEEEPFVALYTGTHGMLHGMDVIIEAAAVLHDVQFVLVGDGVAKPELIRAAAERGLTNVEFRESVPPAELNEVLAESDVCLATSLGGDFLGESIPVKLFDYMAAGRPVVGALPGDPADVLRKSGGGIVVEPENALEMIEAIRRLREDAEIRERMGEVGRRFVEGSFSRDHLGGLMVDLVGETYARGRRSRPTLPRGVYGPMKRVGDFVLSAGGLVFLAPLLLALWLAVRIDSPGPGFFRQKRGGRWSTEFEMLKFRTMHYETPDVATHLLDDPDAYVTRVGRFLRRTSLDELPQLVNTVKGDMSIVGPRPALYNQYDLISMRRDVDVDRLRPGITGWAQVNGRDELPLDEKVALDAEYARTPTFQADARIMWRTISAVFTARGAK